MMPICPCAVLSAVYPGLDVQECACGADCRLPGFPLACGRFCGRLHRHHRTASWNKDIGSFCGQLYQHRRPCLQVGRRQGRRSKGSRFGRFFCFSFVTSVSAAQGGMVWLVIQQGQLLQGVPHSCIKEQLSEDTVCHSTYKA